MHNDVFDNVLAPNLQSQSLPLSAIPVIDVAALKANDLAARQATAEQIGTACREVGFFYIKNHGISEQQVAATFAAARQFFALPLARKQAIAIEQSPCHRGYFALGGENLDPLRQQGAGDLKEGIKIGRDLPPDHPRVQAGTPLHGPNQWPSDWPDWRETMQGYYTACQQLGLRLMRALALALDLPEHYFDAYLREPMATLGPLHYPPQSGSITEAQIGAGAHTDFGCLTLLAQDTSGGLQVRNLAGEWLDAPPIPGTLVVNIGDMLARWTNDQLRSTLHRVINRSGGERYSLPFFYDPEFDTPLACLETCTGPDNPPRYPPTTAGQYLLDRINETFAYHRAAE
jgi:isopenicillin N synthase-like dioxygenase